MDLVDKYLGEADVRGVVKSGKVNLDTAVDFQRQILNQSYHSLKSLAAGNFVSRALGAKRDTEPVSQEEIEKIYRESKKYWKEGGKYIKVEGKPVKLALHFNNHEPAKGQYYASYSWGGWVGSTKLYKKPDQAMKAIEKQLMQTVKEKGSLRDTEYPESWRER